MSLWMEHLNELQHYHTLRREAEQHRLARLALESSPKNHQVRCKVLSWFGAHLSTWGRQLQERYGIAAASYPCVRNQTNEEQIIKGLSQ